MREKINKLVRLALELARPTRRRGWLTPEQAAEEAARAAQWTWGEHRRWVTRILPILREKMREKNKKNSARKPRQIALRF